MKNLKLKINPLVGLLLVLLGLLIIGRFFEVDIRLKGRSSLPQKSFSQSPTAEEQKAIQAFLKFKEIKASLIPSGVPDIYGQELDISFDQVQDGINKLRVFGPTYGTEEEKIELEGKDLERYIRIGKQTACQYCCGVDALVKDDGSAACGCAHSIAMRGLAAYLIKNYSQEFSDEEILAEVNKWKTTFFPKQTLTAKFEELKKAGDRDIESLLKEFPDFLPQMVGGC